MRSSAPPPRSACREPDTDVCAFEPIRRCGLTLRPDFAGQSGFTLTELLILMAVVLLLTLVAIPNFGGMKIETNENAAIAGLRSIYEAEVAYQAAYPTEGFACSLGELGGRAAGGSQKSPRQAQLLPNELASGRKSGYIFALTGCTESGSVHTAFEVTAIPQVLGKTGHRGFCIDQRGETRADATGGTDCSESLE